MSLLHALPRAGQLLPRRAARSVATLSQATSILPSTISSASPEFQANAAAMQGLVSRLDALHSRIARGGSDKARARHTAKGKLLARERIAALLDAGSPFLELSPLAGHEMYGEDIPAAGVVTGIGNVEG
jgi:3-methylcrotonyl-CoA carboxylase beta subunit